MPTGVDCRFINNKARVHIVVKNFDVPEDATGFLTVTDARLRKEGSSQACPQGRAALDCSIPKVTEAVFPRGYRVTLALFPRADISRP